MSWKKRPFAPEPGTYVCDVGHIPDGGGYGVSFGGGEEAFRLVLLRSGGDIWAYMNNCPHFSLPLNFEEQKFLTLDMEVVCAHHTAFFRFDDGMCTEGPCRGNALEAVPVGVNGEHVYIVARGADTCDSSAAGITMRQG